MQFEIANATGDSLRIELPAGKFMLVDGVELEAIAAPPRQLTEEELRAARDAEWRAEQDTLIEQRKRLFNKLPKRGQLVGNDIRWEYWDGRQWQPYELPVPPFFFVITEIPDPDALDFKQPPER